jgi:hypothetical protein
MRGPHLRGCDAVGITDPCGIPHPIGACGRLPIGTVVGSWSVLRGTRAKKGMVEIRIRLRLGVERKRHARGVAPRRELDPARSPTRGSRLANGKVIEEYTNWDTFGMMQQLGVVPELAHA